MTNNSSTLGQLLFNQLEINIDEVPIDYLSGYTAVEYYLTIEDEPPPNSTNIDNVRRYLEAFHHLSEVGDWTRMSKILLLRLNTPNQEELHQQLQTWGYYREALELYEEILDKLPPHLNWIWLNGLGNVYRMLAEYEKAINYSEQSLVVAQKINDRPKEAGCLRNLGTIYGSLGQFPQAIEYLEKSLAMLQSSRYANAEEMNAEEEIGKVFHNLGNVYGYRGEVGDADKAISYFNRALAVARKMENRADEAKLLGNLGNIYFILENCDLAIDYFEQNLAIAQEIEDQTGISICWGNLGAAYAKEEKYSEAINYFQKYLAMAKETGDKSGQGYALCNLGEVFLKLGQYSEARENLHKALNVSQKIGDSFVEQQTCRVLEELNQKLNA